MKPVYSGFIVQTSIKERDIMNRSEAIKFYEKKYSKARSRDSRIAYECILDVLRYHDRPETRIQLWSTTSPSAARRSIFKRAIGELRV